MQRIDLRSPGAWRSLDRWSALIALVVPFTFAMAWIAGLRPPGDLCCSPLSSLAAKAPAVPVADRPKAAPDVVIAPDVELALVDRRLILRGHVSDEATRAHLVGQARQTFALENVTDRLIIDASRGPLSWLSAADEILADLSDMTSPATIRAGGGGVILEGTAGSEHEKDQRGLRARLFFGDNVSIHNNVRVVAPKPAPVPAPEPATVAVDCAAITEGAHIAFASGSSSLTQAGRLALDAIAPCLTEGVWEVAGHTDRVGGNRSNQALSERRAAAAVEYLTRTLTVGVSLTSVGYGPRRPIADNRAAEGRAKNRRISFEKK